MLSWNTEVDYGPLDFAQGTMRLQGEKNQVMHAKITRQDR